MYVVNCNRLCGIGVVGELCIAGEGLAKEYLNAEELTKSKFVKNPFGDGLLYRTGDLARVTGTGDFEYIGRADEQIKIRGFRVEPGEIEDAIRKHISVENCFICTKRTNMERWICMHILYLQNKLILKA